MSKIMYGGIAYGSVVDKDYGWTDLTGTLVAGETALTIQHESITTDVTIEPYSDPFGISPKDMVVTNGQVVLTFNAQPNDVKIMVRVSKTCDRAGGLDTAEFKLTFSDCTITPAV